MGDVKKIFDDFPSVDCNECESWWLNQCDGVPVGSEKPCTAFKAVRRVNIPLEIDRLRTLSKWLTVALFVLALFVLMLMVEVSRLG